MTLSFRPGHRILVFNELIDMRSGFERLSMLIRERMKQQLLEGDLFVALRGIVWVNFTYFCEIRAISG